MTHYDAAAELTGLVSWINEQLADEGLDRQYIAESAVSRIADITLQMLGAAELRKPRADEHWLAPVLDDAAGRGNLEALRKQMLEQGRAIIDDAIAQAVAEEEKRIFELEELARSMLASFTRTDSGYACRVGQVRIAQWTAIMNGGTA